MHNPSERPTPGARLRVLKHENGVVYADPLGGGAGVSLDKKTIEEFGEGDYFFGNARIVQYLLSVLHEHGTILPALGIKDSARETASRMMGFENAASPEEIEAWRTKLRGMDEYTVAELLNNVETWEKTRKNV